MFNFLTQGVLGELLAPVRTPGQQLHSAIEDGLNDKAIRLVHQDGVNFNYPDPIREDAMPLHTACKYGNGVMVDSLLQLGANINCTDRHRNTPLHYAARHGKIELVKHLVAQGADVTNRNVHRQTPYDVAENHVVRQYLLPLQLRAEPEPEPSSLLAVHNPDAVRDYSNLPPPPTATAFAEQQQVQVPGGMQPQHGPPVVGGPPPSSHIPVPAYSYKPSGWTDPSVTRPIAPDGFHCSVGNPELEAKYGHIKQTINALPPPTGGSPVQGAVPAPAPLPPANPAQYSAFTNGRPMMPRYVAYNAVDGTTSAPYAAPPPAFAAQQPLQQQQQPPQVMSSAHLPSAVPTHRSSPPRRGPTQPGPPAPQAQPQPPQLPIAPPTAAAPSQAQVPAPRPYDFAYPLPPKHQPIGQQRPVQQPQQAGVQHQRTSSIPTLPSPNAVSVFQPLADNGDDAIALDESNRVI